MNLDLSDFHSHLLPAVDDGSRSVEEAMEGIGRMVTFGVTRIITTPHIQASLTTEPEALANAMLDMDEAWSEIHPEVAKAFPELDFRRGHEVMLDIPDPDLTDPRFRLGGTRFILVEWPRLHIPPGTVGVIERIVAGGLTPVIAHPERYSGIDPHLEVMRGWKSAGAFLQGNYGSLIGRYGAGVRGMVLRLLEAGLLDYLSSDFHGRPEYELFIEAGQTELEKLGGGAALELLGVINPLRLFDGQGPIAVPGVPLERTFMQRMREWLVQ